MITAPRHRCCRRPGAGLADAPTRQRCDGRDEQQVESRWPLVLAPRSCLRLRLPDTRQPSIEHRCPSAGAQLHDPPRQMTGRGGDELRRGDGPAALAQSRHGQHTIRCCMLTTLKLMKEDGNAGFCDFLANATS